VMESRIRLVLTTAGLVCKQESRDFLNRLASELLRNLRES
jgi:hypothetical protein